MPVDAILVYGTRVWDSTDNVTYTEFTDCASISAIGSPSAPEIDVTPLADSADFRQFKAGLSVSGEFTVRQYFTKARMSRVIAAYRTTKYWRVTFPDHATPASASRVVSQGFIKNWKPPEANNPDDPAVIEFTVKLTGAPTFTEAS